MSPVRRALSLRCRAPFPPAQEAEKTPEKKALSPRQTQSSQQARPSSTAAAAPAQEKMTMSVFEIFGRDMKRAVLSGLSALAIVATVATAQGQTTDDKPYDPITLLKDLSSDLGELEQFSFETTGIFDERNDDQLIKRIVTWSVTVARPNRYAIKVVADDGDTWLGDFDGTKARIFYVGAKQYAEIPFVGDVSAFVDFADETGLSRTPLNDFLRKDLFGDVEESIFDATLIAGFDDPEEENDLIHHVLFQSTNSNWQLWIRETEERYTPHRFVVTYVNQLGQPEFFHEFHNWKTPADVDAAAEAYGIPDSLEGWTKVEIGDLVVSD